MIRKNTSIFPEVMASIVRLKGKGEVKGKNIGYFLIIHSDGHISANLGAKCKSIRL